MAAEIKKAVGIDSTLTPGERGIFDVIVDGVVIYSKHKTGEFPKVGEIAKLLAKRP